MFLCGSRKNYTAEIFFESIIVTSYLAALGPIHSERIHHSLTNVTFMGEMGMQPIVPITVQCSLKRLKGATHQHFDSD